jgi:hypothetical protein
MMVKDGLQIGYASLIQAISPFMMEQYLNHVDTASNALRSNNNELITSTFGLNFEDLKSEFIEGYLLSNRSNTLLNNYNFTTTLTGDLIKPENVNIVDNTLNAKSEDVNPLFVRVTDTFEGRDFTKVTYKTYRLTGADKDVATYTEVETAGSNQQNPIGFMFGDRPTYNQVRGYVKSREKKEDTVEEEQQLDRTDQVKQRAAQRPGANIVVNGDNIEIDGVNLDDILEGSKPAQQTSADDTVDPALLDELDNINEDAQQLTLDLFNELKKFNEEINDNYAIIENFWDSNIQFNKEVKNSLRENNNILSLEDLIKEYEDGIYKDQEEFVEQIKKCNL